MLTVDDTYKTLTTTDNIFGTHGAKNMYDELTTAIGAKANATDLTTHTGDTDIHITSVEREAWNNKANDNEVIKKTDITTTIDATSTDDTVPSAKAVNDILSTATGITNVPLTNIAIPSGMFAAISSGAYIKYEVFNGIAFLYINLRSVRFANIGDSGSLPIPKTRHSFNHTIMGEGLVNGITVVGEGTNMKVWTLGNTTVTTHYLACISYPVAKS